MTEEQSPQPEDGATVTQVFTGIGVFFAILCTVLYLISEATSDKALAVVIGVVVTGSTWTIAFKARRKPQ